MALETLEPNPAWVEDAYADTVEILETHSDDLVYRIWCGDWCSDCRSQLPDLGAALEAASIPEENVVEHELDENKNGPGVDEYDVEYIPTVVVEHDGEKIARFVEDEGMPIAVYLADEIEAELAD